MDSLNRTAQNNITTLTIMNEWIKHLSQYEAEQIQIKAIDNPVDSWGREIIVNLKSENKEYIIIHSRSLGLDGVIHTSDDLTSKIRVELSDHRITKNTMRQHLNTWLNEINANQKEIVRPTNIFDSWGNEIEFSHTQTEKGLVLISFSLGADGKDKTPDDIVTSLFISSLDE